MYEKTDGTAPGFSLFCDQTYSKSSLSKWSEHTTEYFVGCQSRPVTVSTRRTLANHCRRRLSFLGKLQYKN